MYYTGYMGFFGGIWVILFWGAVIWLTVWLINQNKDKLSFQKKPLDIIKERYAKGEINKKQYDEMKKELGR